MVADAADTTEKKNTTTTDQSQEQEQEQQQAPAEAATDTPEAQTVLVNHQARTPSIA
jgi:hypothetical protein